MRLGAQLFAPYANAEEWVQLLKERDLRAAYCPIDEDADDETVESYRKAAEKADIVISEVGTWHCSLLHEKKEEREEAYRRCLRRLKLADRIGARCMVSIAGSCGGRWDGPHPKNLTEETFDELVRVIQKLLDEVHPVHTYYTVEAMPWMLPDSLETYERLINAVNRNHFGVHYDPVNLVHTHRAFYENGRQMEEFVQRLGGKIRSCHVKDVGLEVRYNTVILEKKTGEGALETERLLIALNKLDPNLPVMTEHLESEEENRNAHRYLRACAERAGIQL